MKEKVQSFPIPGRYQKKFILTLSFLLILSSLIAEAQQPLVADRLNGIFLKQILADTGQMITSPARWSRNNWLVFGLSLASSCAWLPVDNSIHEWIQDSHHPGLTSVSKVFSGAGQPLSLIGILSAGYLVGELTHSSSWRQTSLLAAESLLITELFVQFGKITFGRARPYNLEGALSFHPFTLRGQWQSFPSGHSAAAWAVATTVASRTRAGYLKALFYSLAAGVSVSRVILDKHFSSDIVASSLLGYYLGQKVARRASRRANQPGQPVYGLSIAPGLISFNFNYQF